MVSQVLHIISVHNANWKLAADRILMLEKGKVIESGTHDELMTIENGKYAEMSRLALGETDFGKKKKDSSASSHADSAEPRERTFSADEETAINTPLPLSPLIEAQAV
jgi:ABC-type multidrug transport system ATPase subunit